MHCSTAVLIDPQNPALIPVYLRCKKASSTFDYTSGRLINIIAYYSMLQISFKQLLYEKVNVWI